jgi:hypothetical protein
MRYLPAILLILLFCFSHSLSWASERDLDYLDTPIPSYFYPDTNFTLMSHGFPTSPWDQVLVNGHLYVAMGAYFIIYEVLPDGRLQETCSKMTDHVIMSMAHDGSYLYLSGDNGIQIYDGMEYVNPQLIGSNPMRLLQWAGYISVWGDSLYYWYLQGEYGCYLGIMDVHDPANPIVVGEYESFINWDSPVPPQKYSNYLIFEERRGSYPYHIITIIDLYHSSGYPTAVDSLPHYARKLKVFDNRLYVCGELLYIYEFNNIPHPELQSIFTFPSDIFDIAEVESNGNRYGYVCSWGDFIYKINLNDLANPVIVDSLITPPDQHDFRNIEQHGDYSYAMSSLLDYNEHPGVRVVDWTLHGGPEIVQTAQKYSFCRTVKVIGDAAYAETVNDGILVVDLADKTNPGVVDLGYAIWGQYVKGDSNTLYTRNGNSVLFYDLNDPLAPFLEWTCPVPLDPGRYLFDYEVYDTLLIAYYYIGSIGGPGAAKILDISDRNDVRVLSTIPVEDHIRPMCLDYPRLYLPTNEHWYTEIYDISDPANPDHLATLHNSTGSISGVYTYENYVYVTGGANRVYHWNQWNQIVFDRLLDFGLLNAVAEGGRLFYWGNREWGGATGIHVWDVWQDPVYPIFSGFHYDVTTTSWRKIDVEWPYVYIPGGDEGLVVLRYDSPTGIVEEQNNLPNNYEISITNYPNPFNSSTTIRYILPEPGNVRIDIYDLLGRKVQNLVKEEQQAGTHSIVFDASNLDRDQAYRIAEIELRSILTRAGRPYYLIDKDSH